MAKSSLKSRNSAVKKIRVKNLLPDPLNWHTHGSDQRAALKGIFDEVGFVGFILVRKAPGRGMFFIVDGHERVNTIREQYGEDEFVDCSVLDVTEDEARKILISHDSIGSMGGVDLSILEELSAMVDFSDDTLSGIIQGALAGIESSEEKGENDSRKDSGKESPEDFKEVDENIPVNHTCPKCGYRFSGGK